MTTTSIMVRDHNNPSVVATTGSFTVSPAPAETMTVRTPLGSVVGLRIVLAGTYANGTPAAIDYSTDAGATWFALGSPAISGGSWSGAGPTFAAANAAAQIMVRDHGNTSVTATTASFAVSSAQQGGTLLSQVFTLNNPADQPVQVNPFFSFASPFAPSEVPATGHKMALYDASGATPIMDLQFDQVAAGWLDNSANLGAISGRQSVTLNPGDTVSFTVKCVPGTADTTPCCTLAQLAARTDIKAVFKIGPDTYTVSANTIISKYNYGSARPSYPVGFIEQWKSGPHICENMLAQYLIRDSDGAQHRWLLAKLYVSMLDTGDFYVVLRVENAQSYGAHPSGTIGSTGLAGILTIDSIEIMNGSVRIGTGGGVNDPRKGTFAPAAVNVAAGSITCQMAGVNIGTANWAGPFYSSIGFASTGKLPGAVGAADTYWVWIDASKNLVPFINRFWLASVDRGNLKKITLTAGLAVTTLQYVIANGAYYACTKAGTSDGVAPSGDLYTDANGVIWTRISSALTDQGTGTHTVYPKVSINQWGKADIVGTDTYPFWGGAGSMPKLLPGYPLQYLTQKTRAIPPLPLNLTLNPWVGPIPVYYWNTSYLPGQTNYFYIGDVGAYPVDERINEFGPTAAANILLPNDVGIARSMRYIALSFVDRLQFPRDERSQQQVVANYGPDKLGGTYPGMGPSNPVVQQGGSRGGSPPLVGVGNGWPGYGGTRFDSGGWDASHSPNPFYWAYIHSGHPMFLDAMMEYCNAQHMSAGGIGSEAIRSVAMNGLNYTFAFSIGVQPRGYGHQFKTTWQTEWSIPSNHPAKPYYSDRMDDTANQFMNWIKSKFSAAAQAAGWIPTIWPTNFWNVGTVEPWMQALFVEPVAHVCWINTRPGFGELLEYMSRSWLRLWDSDQNGTVKSMDAQYYWWSNQSIKAGTVVTPGDTTWISDPFVALSSTYPASNNPYTTAYPPPANNFINGLQTQSKHVYVYYTTPIGPAQYMVISRSAMVLAAVAGFPDYAKVLARVDSLLASSGVPIAYVQPATQVPVGNRNGLMFARDPF